MSFYHELEGLNLVALIGKFHEPAPDGTDYAPVYFGEVASLIQRQGQEGTSFLRAEIGAADTPRLTAILFALTESGQATPQLKQQLLGYLSHQDPSVVAEAIDGLARIGAKDCRDRALPLRNHPSPYVRGAVLRFIGRLDKSAALPTLLAGLKDPHFVVRENAADELGELRDAAAMDDLQLVASQDAHRDVRQAARTAIEILQSIESGNNGKTNGGPS
jgi:hypothetical protein